MSIAMEAEGIDLVGLLEGPTPMPEELDDLFPEELMQYLTSSDSQPIADTSSQQLPQLPTPPQAAAVPSSATVPAVSSCSSRSEGSASPSPALPPPSPPCSAPMMAPLPVPPVAAIPRLVTTTAAQQMWTAMLQAAYSGAPPLGCINSAPVQIAQQAGASRQGSHECSVDSSDSDQDDMEMVDSKNKASAGSKRKAPEVDWRQIEDPAERRRQRRLAKNRVTAARSRERKKAMWSELEEKLKSMENENLQLRAMLEQFARENASLKTQLLTMTRAGMAAGGTGPASHARVGKTMDPAVILPVFIVTLLVVCSLLPGDKAVALLGSVLPLALLASLATSGDFSSATMGSGALSSSFDALFRLLHMIGSLASVSSRSLQRSLKRLLFDRQRLLGRAMLKRLGNCALTSLPQSQQQQQRAKGAAAAASPVAEQDPGIPNGAQSAAGAAAGRDLEGTSAFLPAVVSDGGVVAVVTTVRKATACRRSRGLVATGAVLPMVTIKAEPVS